MICVYRIRLFSVPGGLLVFRYGAGGREGRAVMAEGTRERRRSVTAMDDGEEGQRIGGSKLSCIRPEVVEWVYVRSEVIHRACELRNPVQGGVQLCQVVQEGDGALVQVVTVYRFLFRFLLLCRERCTGTEPVLGSQDFL